jgi:membrane protein DedA with SNARE-associated domain
MIEHVILTITNLPNEAIYLLLLIIAFIEYFFPPFPSDTIIIFSAYLVVTGKLDFLTLYCISVAGNLCGFLGLFYLGRHYGRGFFLRKNYRFLSRDLITQLEGWFRKYGIGLIAANRFLSGIRSAVPLFAGLSNMKFIPTAAAGFLSSLLWNALLLSGGYYLGKNWQHAVTILKHYNQVVIVLVIIVVSCILWARKRKMLK